MGSLNFEPPPIGTMGPYVSSCKISHKLLVPRLLVYELFYHMVHRMIGPQTVSPHFTPPNLKIVGYLHYLLKVCGLVLHFVKVCGCIVCEPLV
jgi:hypothetical protein